MFLMSSSIILCKNSIFSKRISHGNSFSSNYSSSVVIQLSRRRKRFSGLVPNAKKRYKRKKRSWWQKFFFDDDGNWLGLKDEDMIEELESEDDNDSSDEEVSENEKFEAWKRRAEAIVELREAQEDMKNEENKMWEDWIVEGENNDVSNGSSWLQDTKENVSNGSSRDEDEEEREELFPLRGLVKSVRGFVVGQDDDDLLYEDRVFRFASFNSAKFLAVLVLIPWALDFFAHDYVLMPFLDRYVKTVPLASQILDVRRSQKLEMVKEIKLTEARYRLEVEIGQSPSLSEEDLYMELRNKALELRDEWRLRNRSAFANIWSDMVFGVSLFLLLYFNQSKVSLLKFTGYKIINNISDTGKAFLIILLTDIFLGYHSESGWETLLEILVEHYGLEVDQSAITIFVCLVPVIIDACVKLWMFKFLPRLSPRVSTIFQEMSRH